MTLDALLKENEQIMSHTVQHQQFKQMHQEIIDFALDRLRVNIKNSTKPSAVRPDQAGATDELVRQAEGMLKRYHAGEMTLPYATARTQEIEHTVREYQSHLPRLIKESYKAFKQFHDRDWRKAKRFAENFRDYHAAGERYGIRPWWSASKLKHASTFIANAMIGTLLRRPIWINLRSPRPAASYEPFRDSP